MQIETNAPKPWQKGFEIGEINRIKKSFDEYNAFVFGPFSKWNGPKIADSLSKKRLIEIPGAGFIDTHMAKTSNDVVMYYDILIGRKERGDRIINAIGIHDVDKMAEEVDKISTTDTWLIILEEDSRQKEVAKKANFKKIGVKINTFSEIFGIYFRDNVTLPFGTRVHPQLQQEEKLTMVKANTENLSSLCDSIAERLHRLDLEYTNHYSKHNKGKAWSALALRGYSEDPSFISKPACMGESWNKEHAHEIFELQDTELRSIFPEVEQIIALLGPGNQERIRFMRLAPGGGELTRHTDQVEPDAGVKDGTLMRIHIPIKTNPDVKFTVWNYKGEEQTANMKKGELWYLDIRKPHRALNGGTEERIHLVIDIGASNELRAIFPKEVD